MDNNEPETGKFLEVLVIAIVPVIVGILIILSWALSFFQVVPFYISGGLALAATLFGGYLRFLSGFRDIWHRKITVNVFVTVALIATMAVGQFLSAALIVFIMAVVGAFESYTLDKTKKNIRSLLNFAPKMANVRRGTEEVTIPAAEVQIGDIVVIRPGERVPVDGIVVTGASSVNQAPITGESIPVEKVPGSEVFSATMNETGHLEVRTTRVGEDTTLARIVHLVEGSTGYNSPDTGYRRPVYYIFPPGSPVNRRDRVSSFGRSPRVCFHPACCMPLCVRNCHPNCGHGRDLQHGPARYPDQRR